MKTVVSLPTADLLPIKEVNIDLDLTAAQHERLLVGSPELFERVVASVMDELIEEDAYSLPLRVLISFFMMVKAHSISPDWTIEWVCQKHKKENGQEVECGFTNKDTVSVGSLAWKLLEKGYVYPRVAIMYEDKKIPVYVRFLQTREEFEVIDYFLEQRGTSKDALFKDNKTAFEYYSRRVYTALEIEDDRFRGFTVEEKAKLFKETIRVSAQDMSKLYSNMQQLESVGYDLKPIKCRCKECSGVTMLQLPLSAGLLVSPSGS